MNGPLRRVVFIGRVQPLVAEKPLRTAALTGQRSYRCCGSALLSQIERCGLIVLVGPQMERMSQQHHEVAGLALKGTDIPKKAHEWTREPYHLKLAGWTFGPLSRCHDIPAAKAPRRNAPSRRLFQQRLQ